MTPKPKKSVYPGVAGVVLAVALILMAPLIAMQFTDEVVWTPADFIVAGALLISTGLAYVLTTRKADTIVFRAAIGMALGTALLLVWVNLAVGIIGSENNPANLMYLGVLAVGIIGAIIARLQPHGMARTLFAAALAQSVVTVIALIGKMGSPNSGSIEIVLINGFFILLWVGSGLMFRRAAQMRVGV